MGKKRPSKWYENIVEASSYDAFYQCVTASTHKDPDPTTTYERDYGPLENKIAEVFRKHSIPSSATIFFDDWSPNRSRHVWIERRFVSSRVVEDVYKLLSRKYESWRIELILVGSIEQCDVIGIVMLFKQWVLCHREGRQIMNEVG